MRVAIGVEENEAPSLQSRMAWACCNKVALSQHEKKQGNPSAAVQHVLRLLKEASFTRTKKDTLLQF